MFYKELLIYNNNFSHNSLLKLKIYKLIKVKNKYKESNKILNKNNKIT